MSHYFFSAASLSLGHFFQDDNHSYANNDCKYQENIVGQQLSQIRESQCQDQVGNPVGKHANSQCCTSSVLSETLRYIQESLLKIEKKKKKIYLQGQKYCKQNKVENYHYHWINKQRFAAKSVNQWYTYNCANNINETSQEDSILNVRFLDGSIAENALRIEKNGVDTTQLLGQLKH
ncbi:hypothetical protein BpHYR1_040153 [Brachionus plicatilis]|uniref:Uncharacterized protein n=1 Tax=Brachionus plicatilis TaxID=10195 RepID=A0A3M7SJV6_BRAPC|nr:hypothetical protein BpHYR1_040153 [Brachionus plicatilis]